MDLRSYAAQRDACHMTAGLVPHPSLGMLEGGPFRSAMDVCLFAKTPSQSTPPSSSGSSSSDGGGALAALILMVLLVFFVPKFFTYMSQPTASTQTFVTSSDTSASPQFRDNEYTKYGSVTVHRLHLRSCASTECAVLNTLSNGDSVRIVGSVGDRWLEIEFSDQYGGIRPGFVSKKYIDTNSSPYY